MIGYRPFGSVPRTNSGSKQSLLPAKLEAEASGSIQAIEDPVALVLPDARAVALHEVGVVAAHCQSGIQLHEPISHLIANSNRPLEYSKMITLMFGEFVHRCIYLEACRLSRIARM